MTERVDDSDWGSDNVIATGESSHRQTRAQPTKTMTSNNAFAAICCLASSNKWCWDLYCTTCGHSDFRNAFFQISLGRHPSREDWKPKTRGRRIDAEQLRDSSTLHRVLAEAVLSTIAAECRFPDYLGYLGLGLFYTTTCELQEPLLTNSWGGQLLETDTSGVFVSSPAR